MQKANVMGDVFKALKYLKTHPEVCDACESTKCYLASYIFKKSEN
jgi:hypothetical protein